MTRLSRMGRLALAPTLACTLAFGMAAPSFAAITIDTTIDGVTLDFAAAPPHLPNHITDDGVPDSTTLPLPTDDNHLVDFTSTTTLQHSGQGGFASVDGPGNGGKEAGFADLTIDPQAPMDGFTKINFGMKALGSGNNTYYGDITLNVFGGGQVKFENVAFGTNGLDHFAIFSNDDRIFSSILFSGLATLENGGAAKNFESIRQVSIQLANGPAVPEPATWAMMILGFGLVGGALRRKGARAAPA